MRDIIKKLEELNVEKEQLNEGLGDMAHEAEKDHEVQMARSDLYKSAKYAVSIHKMLKDHSEMDGIEGWVASKITKAADYLGSVKHYMEGQAMQDVELAVVPVAGDMTDAMTMPEDVVEGKLDEVGIDFVRDPMRRKIIAQVKDDLARGDIDLIDELMSAVESAGYGDLERIADAYIDNEDDDDMMDDVQEGKMKDLEMHIQDMIRDGSSDADIKKMHPEMSDKDIAMIRKGMSEAVEYSGNPNKDDEERNAKRRKDLDKDFMAKLHKALKKKLSDEGGAAGFAPLEKVAKAMDVDLTPAMLKKMKGISQHSDGDYILDEDHLSEKDVVGDIIASLGKMKTPGVMPKPTPKEAPTRGAGDDPEYMKAAATANMPAQQKQRMMNKMVTQSKFSEWGKK